MIPLPAVGVSSRHGSLQENGGLVGKTRERLKQRALSMRAAELGLCAGDIEARVARLAAAKIARALGGHREHCGLLLGGNTRLADEPVAFADEQGADV